jgi:DNA-binding MarR family transcriptional regulator
VKRTRPASPTAGAELGRELSTAVVMFHEAIGQMLGLSAADQRALALIQSKGPVTAGALADQLGLTPGAVTGLLDRLERAGLARRAPDPTDRRRILINATGARHSAVAQAFADLGRAMTEVAHRYSDGELAIIGDWVTRTIGVLRDQTRRLGQPAPRQPQRRGRPRR